MINLVYLSYGVEAEYKKSIFSILSFLFFHPDNSRYRIVVATDDKEYFFRFLPDADITYLELDQQTLTDMVGGTGYIHRRKICVLKNVAGMYPDEDLFYVDSDTFFTRDSFDIFARLDSGTSIMHMFEYRLSEVREIYERYMQDKFDNATQYPEKFLKLISETVFPVNNEVLTFDKSLDAWNSGAIGISRENLGLLDSVLSLSDIFFAKTGWFISEQLAFSLLLEKRTSLLPFDENLAHYYSCKKRVDYVIDVALFKKMVNQPLARKVALAGSMIPDLKKILMLDYFVSVSANSFKKKNLRKGFGFLFKAVSGIPPGRVFGLYLGARIRQLWQIFEKR